MQIYYFFWIKKVLTIGGEFFLLLIWLRMQDIEKNERQPYDYRSPCRNKFCKTSNPNYNKSYVLKTETYFNVSTMCRSPSSKSLISYSNVDTAALQTCTCLASEAIDSI